MRPALFVLMLLTACSRGSPSSVGSISAARVAMLEGLGQDVIVPTFERLADRTSDLRDAIAAVHAQPTAPALEAAQDAWRAARGAWNRGEAFLFGPPADLFLSAKVDVSPVDAALIEEEIAGAEVLDEARIEALGSTRKGFFAIEYLVFDPGGDNGAVVSALVADPRRRDYLLALAENLVTVTVRIRDIWSITGDAFVDDFVHAGAAGSAYSSPKSAEDAVVNHLLVVAEVISDVRLGRPLGKTSGGTPQPPGAEADRSGNSREELLDDLRGVSNLYEGRFDGVSSFGLSHLVRVRSTVIDDVFRRSLEQLVLAVDAIPGPLEDSDREPVEEAFERAKDLKRRILLDLAAALNTTLTFSPFDGD